MEVPLSSIADIKELPLGTLVSLSPKVKLILVENGRATKDIGMYIEEADCSAGICVMNTLHTQGWTMSISLSFESAIATISSLFFNSTA